MSRTQHLLQCFVPGDYVAILPHPQSDPAEVLGIGIVFYIGPAFIKLADGRKFGTIGKRGLNTPGWIVLATNEHRDALQITLR